VSKLLAKITKEVDAGIFPDQPDETPVFWNDGQNIMFPPNYTIPAFGSSIVGELGAGGAITGFGVIIYSGTTTAYVGNSDYIYKFTDPSAIWGPTQVGSGYTGTDQDVWVFAPWGNWILATNGVNAVQVDKGSNMANLDLDSQFVTAKIVLTDPGKQFAFAINTNVGNGLDVWWCNYNDPETWLAAASNLAGDIAVKDTESEFKAGLLLGDNPVIYTRGGQYSLAYVGAPDVWRISKTQDEIGAVGAHAVAAVGDLHFGFSPRGIWKSDGVSSSWIDYGWVRDYIYDDLELTLLGGVVALHAARQNVIIFSFPSSGATENDRSVAFDYQSNRWTILGYGISAGLSADAFDVEIVGFYTGVIAQFGLQTEAINTPISGYGGVSSVGGAAVGYGEDGYGGYGTGEAGMVKLYSRPLNLPMLADAQTYDDDKVAHVDFIRVAVESPSPTLVAYVGFQEDADDATTWSDSQSLSTGHAKLFFDLQDSKFWRLRLEDAQAATKWKMSGVEFHGEILG
jgi:hypothetical protein|tara:strand:+ start:6055 stop:7590 length:1536 start_codon:yes stop_codon:yes gene_type:complete